MISDGVIKFNCIFKKVEFRDSNEAQELIAIRNELKKNDAIGVTPDGIGYGNASISVDENKFLITGSGTGNIQTLDIEGLSLVNEFSIQSNSLSCSGLTKASSESLTHAAIYANCENVECVIHIHNIALWEKLYDKYPTSNPAYEYGTPAIAIEIGALARAAVQSEGIIIMGGHKEGILIYSHSPQNALQQVIELYNSLQ